MKKILLSLLVTTAFISAATCDVKELNKTITTVNKKPTAFNMSNAIFELVKNRACQTDEKQNTIIRKLDALESRLNTLSTSRTTSHPSSSSKSVTTHPDIITGTSFGSGY